MPNAFASQPRTANVAQRILFTVAVIRPDGTKFDAPVEAETFEQLLGLLTRKDMSLLIKRTD